MVNFNTWGPATVLMVLIAVIVVGVGGAVTIVHPETLTFKQYLDDLKQVALAVAGLGGARAIHQHALGQFALAHNTAAAHLDQGDAGKAGK
jgi:hypothetical protein